MARRYLVKNLRNAGLSVPLPREVAHHVGRVMRMRAGDRVVLFDGAGFEAVGRLVETAGGSAALGVELEAAPTASTREPHVAVELAFGVPKGTRADWLFEHACEVGVRRFRPLKTSRTERVGKAEATGRRLARWQRIVEAAAGQCDRAWLPTIDEPIDVAKLLDDPGLPASRFVAAATTAAGDATEPLAAARGGESVLLAIGPEGGFSDEELASFDDAGFVRASLGLLTLRAETAALVGLARLLA